MSKSAGPKTKKPPTRMGRPPGPGTPFAAKVYAAVTPEQKAELEMRALQRKHKEKKPPRWGVSDLVRELIEAYLSTPID